MIAYGNCASMPSKTNSDATQVERIKIPNVLAKKVKYKAPPKIVVPERPNFDPVKAAEEAIERLSAKFDKWIETEVGDLYEANQAAQTDDFSQETFDIFYRCAHDLRGQAETLGYPLVGRVAKNLALLLAAARTENNFPKDLIAQHVDAIRAMVSEDARDETNNLGVELVEKLEEASAPLTEQLEE